MNAGQPLKVSSTWLNDVKMMVFMFLAGQHNGEKLLDEPECESIGGLAWSVGSPMGWLCGCNRTAVSAVPG
jgi:hypothetical protein